MLRKTLIATLVGAMLAAPALATPDYINQHVSNATEVGKSRFTFMMWDVYDIALYAPDGKWNENKPFALALSYLRDLDGEKIAERSAEEIRELGFSDEVKLAAWYAEMKRVFPDVNSKTVLTGIYLPGKPTTFYRNGTAVGTIKDPEFGKWFFNIWLSPKTSQPKLRSKLLSQS